MPNWTNKLKLNQENPNTINNNTLTTHQEDVETDQEDMEIELQQQLYENFNYELTHNDINELSTLLNINNTENDNQEIKKEFEPYLAEKIMT